MVASSRITFEPFVRLGRICLWQVSNSVEMTIKLPLTRCDVSWRWQGKLGLTHHIQLRLENFAKCVHCKERENKDTFFADLRKHYDIFNR